MVQQFDCVVIGSGPGGYVAAIRCAQLGMKTAIIEKYSQLGGTCLNVGCIPSKALLDSTERYFSLVHHSQDHGIEVDHKNIKLNFKKMMERVQSVVKQNSDGINFLMKKNKITVFHGLGHFQSTKDGVHTIGVKNDKGDVQSLTSKKVIIATGSKPSTLPSIKIDKERIITSTEVLKLKEVPKVMLVVGGGVIGVELGSAYARLGVKVQVIEYAPQIIPSMDLSLGKELSKILEKEGMEFYVGHAVQKVERKGNKVLIEAKNNKGETKTFEGDYCLVSVGRRPFTEGLQLENVGLSVNERKQIPVNDHLETVIPGIYAIGDVVRGAMLAHKAEEEGVFVAEVMAGQKPHMNYRLIPGVVYTWPEVSSVGYTEEELVAEKIPFKKGQFPFKASGRARASNESDGFIKVLAHQQTDEVLGIHMIGPRTADLIAEAVALMEFRASAEDIARICHPHPTFSEALKEAALAATDNRALHL